MVESKLDKAETKEVVDFLLSKGKKPKSLIIMALVIASVSMLLILFHVYTAAFTMVDPFTQRHFMLTVVMVLGFLMYPLGRKSWSDRLNWWFLVDLVLIAMSVLPLVNVFRDYTRWEVGITRLLTIDAVMGAIYIIAMLELTRRVVGWVLVIMTAFFIFQAVYAPYMPGPLQAPPTAWHNIVHYMYAGQEGMFGLVAGVITSFLIMFFFFAALLKSSGAGNTLMSISLAATGRYSGGPAKVSVLASSLFGTMSGSPIANVVATGSFTIPMMKKMGFKPIMAGAVEASASTGGQFMPPIMGITAFIIPQFLGVSYLRVAMAAILPCLLYYLAVFLQVHFEAKKTGLVGLPANQLPSLKQALKPSWVIFIPILAMFYLLVLGYSLGRIGLYATLLIVVLGFISRTEPRLTPRSIFNAFCEAARMSLPAAAICGTMGMIIATVYSSGLGDRLGEMIVAMGSGSLWPPIILTAVLCLILGMGVPTPIIYITMVLVTIPALVALGVEPISAHMFTFFVAVSAGITPPVCATAFVAGAMAGAPLMRTGFKAFQLAIVAFLVPFLFVASPELLMIGSPASIAARFAFSIAGVSALAISFEGYLTKKLDWKVRLLFAADAIVCFWPYHTVISIIGTVAFIVLCAIILRFWRRDLQQLQTAST